MEQGRSGRDKPEPGQSSPVNISPIRNWRALEVFLYLWWQKAEINPLYDKGLERIGCFLCPAMLESEYEELRIILPEYARRWDAFLEKWADKKGLPGAFCTWGLWRWHALPPKMRELCKSKGIPVNDDYTLKAGPARVNQEKTDTMAGKTMETLMEKQAGTGFAVNEIRKDFPILGNIIYLDNAATAFHQIQLLMRWLNSNTSTVRMSDGVYTASPGLHRSVTGMPTRR